MRIRRIRAANIPPVNRFEVDNLSDLVVIAGPNGVGKTRLVNQFINTFRNPSQSEVSFLIEATNSYERSHFKSSSVDEQIRKSTTIDTAVRNDASLLTQLLQQNKRRRNYKSGVLYYESNRSITNVSPLTYQFEFDDPWVEHVNWQISLGGLKNRWDDTQHSIFKKIHRQTSSIANRARQLKAGGHSSMNLEFDDPLEPFRDAFFKLLGPKRLVRADLQHQRLVYEYAGNEFPIDALSSGEREVLNITFDFILRMPSDCIVFFDEPELHLHPELLARLISTLRSASANNQFILVSHSPEVISSSLDDTVVFLAPPRPERENQAVVVGRDNAAAEVLHRLGQSIGVIALGKRIVLIEGNSASLDKQTYTHLLDNRFPNLVLLPSGGKGNLHSFNAVLDEVLNQSVWGVDFFMLADRDAAPDVPGSTERFRTLSRYHLENYFLDAGVLASCFADMEDDRSWLRSEDEIESELRRLAETTISYSTALIVSKKFRHLAGNVSLMPKGCDRLDKNLLLHALQQASVYEAARIADAIDSDEISAFAEETYERLSRLVGCPDRTWKKDFPAKTIFSRFCASANISEGRLKTLYLAKAELRRPHPMQEIIDIFADFSKFE